MPYRSALYLKRRPTLTLGRPFRIKKVGIGPGLSYNRVNLFDKGRFKMLRIKLFWQIVLLGLATDALSETLTFKADVWCPFNCEPKGEHQGYLIDLAKAALEPLGNKVDYSTLNWARAIVDTRDGKYTAIVGAAKSDAPDFIFPGTSLGLARNCFYGKKDATWTFKGIDSLKEITFGVVKDYTYEDGIDEYIKTNIKDSKKIDVVAGDNPLELNLKKINAGRITAFLEEDSVLHNYLFRNKLSEDTIKNLGCVKESDIFIGFSPKNPKSAEYAKAVASKLEVMRKDGSFSKILAQYGIKDWVK